MCQTVGSFAERGQLSLYRYILRVAVKKMDTAKPPRGFGDKAEWTLVLNALHQAGKLTYKVESDTITIIEGGRWEVLSCGACRFNPRGAQFVHRKV